MNPPPFVVCHDCMQQLAYAATARLHGFNPGLVHLCPRHEFLRPMIEAGVREGVAIELAKLKP